MKKGVMIGLIILGIVVVAVGGFLIYDLNKNSFSDNNLGETKTLIHKDFRAVISGEWKESEVGSSTFLYLPLNTDSKDINAEFMLINSAYLGENNNFTLDGLLEQGINASEQIMPDFELLENNEWSNGNLEGKEIKFAGTQEEVKREFTQVFGIKYNSIYSVTYSCPIENCNYYESYNSLVESFEPVEAK